MLEYSHDYYAAYPVPGHYFSKFFFAVQTSVLMNRFGSCLWDFSWGLWTIYYAFVFARLSLFVIFLGANRRCFTPTRRQAVLAKWSNLLWVVQLDKTRTGRCTRYCGRARCHDNWPDPLIAYLFVHTVPAKAVSIWLWGDSPHVWAWKCR